LSFSPSTNGVDNRIDLPKNSETISHAGLHDGNVSSLFNSLSSGTVNDVLIDDYYEGVYFSNLTSNFGNNRYGSCSYVAMGMLLSFYDSYWNDLIIPEAYDNVGVSTFVTNTVSNFAFPSFYAESPGVAFEPEPSVEGLSMNEYLSYSASHSGEYFQCKLISLSQSYFGSARFESEESPFGMTFSEIVAFMSYYLYNYLDFTTSQIVINSCNSSAQARAYTVNKILHGTPVILRASSPTLGSHAFIAYDYDVLSDEIYVHTGWKDDASGKCLSHVSLSSTGFTTIGDAISLNLLMEASHSWNYVSASGDTGCACNFIFPQEIELVSGDYRDMTPRFDWKSLFKEKWFSSYNPYFKVSFLNSSSAQVFQDNAVVSKSYTLNIEQWDQILYSDHSRSYYTCVELSSDVYPYWDEYYAKEPFTKPLEYEALPVMKPENYGFTDAYPVDNDTKNNFTHHNAGGGFIFETRRFRTGYIHDEYIVMSPKRSGVTEAYIEYRFNTAVTRIDVELAHWRETSFELLTSDTGEAAVQYYWENRWVDKLDLLSIETAMTTNRNDHVFYKIIFETPIYRIRFHANTFSANTNNSNRGRICIGDMAFYPSEYSLPLSGYELNYEPNIWNSTVVGQFLWIDEYLKSYTNCYSYAVNAQINPNTNSLYAMQPGQSISHSLTQDDLNNPNSLLSLIESDAENLGFGFYSISKYTVCPVGTYKVALVFDPGTDYHWYRQNSDGTWSHKPGPENVTKYDGAGHIIMDPETCDRTSNGLNYSLFLGYYAIMPLNTQYGV